MNGTKIYHYIKFAGLHGSMYIIKCIYKKALFWMKITFDLVNDLSRLNLTPSILPRGLFRPASPRTLQCPQEVT
jgi:hypothetical protein